MSDSGYSVEVLGRAGLRYSEGQKTMVVDSELLAKTGIAIFTNSIRVWRPPFDKEPVSLDKKKEIVSRICDAFASRNEPVEVH